MNIFRYALYLFLALFVISFLRDRRSLRNAVYLGFCLIFLDFDTLIRDEETLFRQIMLGLTNYGIPVLFIGCLLIFAAAGVISIKKEGLSLPMSLSIGFGAGIVAVECCTPLMFQSESEILRALALLITFLELYGLFLFAALLLYSQVYRILPLSKKCDYIVVHGAGLRKDGRVTPLLAGRLDTAVRVFEKTGKQAKILVSGGQGSDEIRSEAEAMREYLLEKGIAPEVILLEDRSTTTMENLVNVKAMMDAQSKNYKCIFVTSDYHVFRTGVFAKQIGLKAEGVGSRTAFYYWPNAFVREYIAILAQHKKVPIVITAFWAVLVAGYYGLVALGRYLGV